MTTAARARLAIGGSFVLALCLACGWGTEEGERARSGECPAGERCSAEVPHGLTFVGQVLFDEGGAQRLGPVLVGGTFDLGLRAADLSALPPFALEVEDPGVLAGVQGEGVFGPTTPEGDPYFHVDGHFTLTGRSEGAALVRVVDARTGELLDRIALDVYTLEDVELRNADDPSRAHLLAGCDEMLGVQLIARREGSVVRGFDQSVRLRADGVVSAEPAFWDCFRYTVPTGRTEVEVQIDAAGQTFARTLEVRTLAREGLTACPPRRRD